MKRKCYLHVQQPCIYPELIVLPYLWMQLETYYNQVSEFAHEWEWIKPIYDTDANIYDVIEMLSQHESLDVVGISTYIWDNHDDVKKLQDWVKTNHPNCIIVMGGPHQDSVHRLDFFRKNPNIDACCEPSGYGEVFWSTLLDQISTNSLDVSIIPFSLYPDEYRMVQKSTTVPNKREITWSVEIYHRHENLIDEIQTSAKHKGFIVSTPIEFSRGCPYFCTFCEWGGTGTKVVFKPFDLIVKDLEFLISRKINVLYVMDANFGIVARDIDIVQKIKELCLEHDHIPQLEILGYAKNNKKYVNQIIDLCAELGVIDELNVSIQSLKEKTLQAIKRVDAPWRQQLHDMEQIRVRHPQFNIRLQVILALPEMTIDDLYEWFDVVHETGASMTAFIWFLLPSTPAFNLEYMKKYDLNYRHAQYLKNPTNGRITDKHITPRSVAMMPVVTNTSTLSFNEFVEILTVSSLVDAGRDIKLLYETMAKLQRTVNLPFSVLYRQYINDVFKNETTKTHVWYKNITEQIISACSDGGGFINIYHLPKPDGFMYDGRTYWTEMFSSSNDWLVEFGMWAKGLLQKQIDAAK